MQFKSEYRVCRLKGYSVFCVMPRPWCIIVFLTLQSALCVEHLRVCVGSFPTSGSMNVAVSALLRVCDVFNIRLVERAPYGVWT